MTKLDPIAELKSDHAQVRDILLDLIDASGRRDAVKALELLLVLDKLGGPHFWWEEESFYPTLERFFGSEYKEYLFNAHDRIIRAVRKLSLILGKGEITDDDARQIPILIRTEILPHPIECEGLTLFSERLTEEELRAMAEKFKAIRKKGLSLLEWADQVRPRKV